MKLEEKIILRKNDDDDGINTNETKWPLHMYVH